MLTTTAAVQIAQRRTGRWGSGVFAGRPQAAIVRNLLALRTSNAIVFGSGFIEPVFYLLAFGFGLGSYVGTVEIGGEDVSYAVYIAPALLASSAMGGAIADATFNVFFKMHEMRLYQAMTSTSLGALDVALGEIGWATIRGGTYAVGFVIVSWIFGLVTSWWALLAIPAAMLVAFGFAAVGMGITSYTTSFQQLNWVNFALIPLFLFSGTFFPISVYPDWLQAVIMATPLWQGIAMTRGLMLGQLDAALLGHIGYFVVLVLVGVLFTTRRLNALFLR